MLLNCGVGEDSWESLGQQGDPTSQSWRKWGLNIHRRTDAEAETPILWPPDVKNWLIWKDPDAGKDWRQEEKGTTEDKMVGWHHRLDEHEFEQVPGVGDGQGSLGCCSPWGCRVRHDWATERNCSMVGSQWCASFCCYTHTYIHSFSDSIPIQVITEYWVEFPALYRSSLQTFRHQEPVSWQTVLPWTRRLRDGFRMTQVCYIYCAVYFYYYYIGSTSDHQTLDPRGWRPPQYSVPLLWSNQPGTRCVGVAPPSSPAIYVHILKESLGLGKKTTVSKAFESFNFG